MEVKERIAQMIYQESYGLLKEKAINSGIEATELEKYFEPLNEDHMNYYRKVYDFGHNLNFESNDFLLMRFISSAFNSGYHNDITNNPVKFIELAKLVKLFDFSLFHRSYESLKDLKEEARNHAKYPLLNTLDSGRLDQKVRSVYTIAKYLKENDLRTMEIKLRNPKEIFGMREALYCDAIKEAGLLDIAKPDVHIIDIVNALFNKDYDKNGLRVKELDEIQSIMSQIAEYNNITVYQLDKVLWMVSAKPGNTFYLHNLRNYKLELLQRLRTFI